MSIYIDQKYLNILSGQLERFTRKREDLYNFRCPICGDSEKHQYKARGYVYRKTNGLYYRCHNCGAGMSLSNLIRDLNPGLHQQYVMDTYTSNSHSKSTPVERPKFKFETPEFKTSHTSTSLDEIVSIDKLPEEHYCRQYVKGRNIPEEHYKNLYFAENFKEWVVGLEISKDDIYKHLYEEPRLVIPFFDSSRNMIAAQGRALGESDLRYITIKIDEHQPKIFGLDRIDKNKPIFVVEGPIDSLFIDNCIAVAGGDLTSALSHLIDCDLTFVYDNERRNRETVKKMESTIDRHHKVVIWPKYVREKDINEMILSGINVPDVLDTNTFYGLTAKTKMLEFKI